MWVCNRKLKAEWPKGTLTVFPADELETAALRGSLACLNGSTSGKQLAVFHRKLTVLVGPQPFCLDAHCIPWITGLP